MQHKCGTERWKTLLKRACGVSPRPVCDQMKRKIITIKEKICYEKLERGKFEMKKKINLVAFFLAAALLGGCGGQKQGRDGAVDNARSAEAGTADADQTDGEGIELADGVYMVDFKTDSSMFKVNESKDGKGILNVRDGKAILHISLTSKNIVNLYLGTAEKAKEDEAGWLQPTVDTVTYSDGLSEEVNGFDVPVSAIGEEFDLALIGKKGTWYDHKVRVENPVLETERGTGNSVSIDELEDGTYTCAVTLQGGSGRASVESPAKLTVQSSQITAEIIWSSPNYEYMLVDGKQYDPVQKEGNATFYIPAALDKDIAVSALTVAMSEPHLIEYTLHFDSSSLKKD